MTRAVWGVLLVLTVIPLWVGDQIPLLDWPQHLAIATILRHHGDPAWGFDTIFELDTRPLPYALFHVLTALGGLLVPIPVAGKLVLSLYAFGTPLSVMAVFRAYGRDERLAWFAIPVVFNRLMSMGLVPFLLGLPLWFLVIATTERAFTGRGRVWIPGVLAALGYFAHGYVAVGILGSLVVLVAVHRPPLRAVLPFLPFLGLFAYWVMEIVIHPEANLAQSVEVPWQTDEIVWLSASESIQKIPSFLFEVHVGRWDDTLAVLLMGLLALLVVLRPDPIGPTWRLDLHVALLGLSYFVAPHGYGTNLYLSARNLVVFAFLAACFAGSRPFEGRRRIFLVPLVALAALVPLWHLVEYRRFEASATIIQEIVGAASEGGGRTLGLIRATGKDDPWREGVYHHYAAWHQVYRGGDSSPSFVGFPNVPVRYRNGARPAQPVEWFPETFDPELHLSPYDRVLVRGDDPGIEGLVVFEEGPWRLIELGPTR